MTQSRDRLNWFFPALMVLVGAHYLPFATLYGMPMLLFLAGILIAAGVVIAPTFRNVQPGFMDRRTGPVRFRLDWTLPREAGTRKLTHRITLFT